jgi:hypothetical protein
VLVGNGSGCLRPLVGQTRVPRSAPQSVSCIPHYHPGQRDLPSRVGSEDYPSGVFPVGRLFKRGCAYAVSSPVYSLPRLVGWCAIFRTLRSGPPFRSRLSPPRAPWLQRRYPPSSLLRAHGPVPMPPAGISCSALIMNVLAACTLHGCSPGSSRLWTAFLYWSAVSSIPAARQVHLASSSSTTSAFAPLRPARLSACSPTNGFPWATYFDTAGIP